MSNSVWIVGQSLDRDKDGNVVWRKLGTFTERGLAESWKAYVDADILLEQIQPGVTVLPMFTQVAVSVFPPNAKPCEEGGICH